eukprot:SAG11_NODE_540_length_8654_cov_9.626110_12_plen_89_part_01
MLATEAHSAVWQATLAKWAHAADGGASGAAQPPPQARAGRGAFSPSAHGAGGEAQREYRRQLRALSRQHGGAPLAHRGMGWYVLGGGRE